jgi:endoglucanase
MTTSRRAPYVLLLIGSAVATVLGVALLATSPAARGALVVRSSGATRHSLKVAAPATGLRFSAHVGSRCRTGALLALALDGRAFGTRRIRGRSWRGYSLVLSISHGSHTLRLRTSATSSACTKVTIRQITTIPAPTPAAGANPFAGQTQWVNPDTSAARQVDAWRASRPADAAQIEKIASRAHANWFGDWTTDPRGDVADIVDRASAAGQLPVLVAYDLPNLDCGGYSAGGASSASAYRSWIDGFAAGIGAQRAVVILEPDALPELDCLSSADQQRYYDLISYAVSTLGAHPGVAVYIDAGNSGWQPVSTMAARLTRAGIAGARGFSLNVSNFNATADETAYGDQLSAALGAKHFVVDTSRNGLGPSPSGEWCNPPGRALGQPPTTQTGDPLLDAYLWIKAPGESDGTCNGGPTAGVWWPDYALGLAQRAAP